MDRRGRARLGSERIGKAVKVMWVRMRAMGNPKEGSMTLGDRVRDTITGIEGIAVGYAQYLNGCNQVCIVGKANAEGKYPTEWFDEQRVEVLAVNVYSAVEPVMATAGGPQAAPPRGAF